MTVIAPCDGQSDVGGGMAVLGSSHIGGGGSARLQPSTSAGASDMKKNSLRKGERMHAMPEALLNKTIIVNERGQCK